MSSLDLSRLIQEALQAGAEAMAKAAGIPQLDYQRIVLSAEWRKALKEKRDKLTKGKKK